MEIVARSLVIRSKRASIFKCFFLKRACFEKYYISVFNIFYGFNILISKKNILIYFEIKSIIER
jgi:hypothetical protein